MNFDKKLNTLLLPLITLVATFVGAIVGAILDKIIMRRPEGVGSSAELISAAATCLGAVGTVSALFILIHQAKSNRYQVKLLQDQLLATNEPRIVDVPGDWDSDATDDDPTPLNFRHRGGLLPITVSKIRPIYVGAHSNHLVLSIPVRNVGTGFANLIDADVECLDGTFCSVGLLQFSHRVIGIGEVGRWNFISNDEDSQFASLESSLLAGQMTLFCRYKTLMTGDHRDWMSVIALERMHGSEIWSARTEQIVSDSP